MSVLSYLAPGVMLVICLPLVASERTSLGYVSTSEITSSYTDMIQRALNQFSSNK